MMATSLNPARSPLLSLFAALSFSSAPSASLLLPALQHNLVGDGPPRAKWLELPELLTTQRGQTKDIHLENLEN